jgi:hypothetical protein
VSHSFRRKLGNNVSVAGCLGYDVLANSFFNCLCLIYVSVAGCLGYDVLVMSMAQRDYTSEFQLLVV